MSNNSTTPAKVILEIPQRVLGKAAEIRGRDPLEWLKNVLEKTENARAQIGESDEGEPSGFASLTPREVAIATLVDKVIESLVDLVMFQAQNPIPSNVTTQPPEIIDPKTGIVDG